MDMYTQKLTTIVRYIIIVSFIIAIMHLASTILIPLAFAMFFALLLYPMCSFIERYMHRILAIIVSFVIVLIVISGLVFFFGSQVYRLFENIKDFGQNIRGSIDSFIQLINETVLRGNIDIQEIYKRNKPENIFSSSGIIGKTISSSTTFLVSLVLVFVYTFLFLLYRTSFKRFILHRFSDDKREKAAHILYQIQKVAQNYFFGLFIIILILGTLNGLGLWLIGIDYPFLFGYFAALLAIIPYIGTFIGGLLPTLYAALNYDSIWTPFLVILWYTIVQTIEGNILTPKIVGSKVSLNPLFALITLLTGALIWGISGMVLFIPFMAVVKVIFDHVDKLKPYGLLFSSDFGHSEFGKLGDVGEKAIKKIKDRS